MLVLRTKRGPGFFDAGSGRRKLGWRKLVLPGCAAAMGEVGIRGGNADLGQKGWIRRIRRTPASDWHLRLKELEGPSSSPPRLRQIRLRRRFLF